MQDTEERNVRRLQKEILAFFFLKGSELNEFLGTMPAWLMTESRGQWSPWEDCFSSDPQSAGHTELLEKCTPRETPINQTLLSVGERNQKLKHPCGWWVFTLLPGTVLRA